MNGMRAAPIRLYKYKKFDSQTLNLLVTDRLYFANPATFNDPLDTRPSVKCDLNVADLESVVRRLVEQRVHAEMSAAAKSLKYKGPKTLEHISRQSLQQAARLISEIDYNAGDPSYEVDDPHRFLLTSYLEAELLKRYNKGIVAFAESPSCPLMWSHYGDQHRGICVGYSVPNNREVKLHPVEYDGDRLVSASDISKMLDGETDAQERVDQAVLFRKAAPWKYEQEWRLIGERGPQDSPLELEEIVFGLRCDPAVAFAIVKAFEGRSHQVRFFEMREANDTFDLSKSDLDMAEALATWPRRSLSTHEAFDAVDTATQAGPSSPTDGL